jgi:hypothetical protein
MAIRMLWIVPLISAFSALIAFGVGYGVAVSRKDEDAWFSFISDGGANPPESCIFSQFLNISAVFLGLTMYLRHHQYVVFYKLKCSARLGWRKTVSVILLTIGLIGALGMSLVANFQEFSVPMVHGIGAWMAFFGGLVYCWGHIILAYAQRPRMTSLMLNHLRVVIAFTATAALTMHMLTILGEPFVKTVDGVKPTKPPFSPHVIKYDLNSPFYYNHLASCIAEWVLALSFELFVVTFAWELAMFEMRTPKLLLIEKFTFKTFGNSADVSIEKPIFGTFNTFSNGTTANRLPRFRPSPAGDFFTATPSAPIGSPNGTMAVRNGAMY